MYTTRGVFFHNNMGQDVTPRQNLSGIEDSFLYEYARYLLHRQLVSEGLLSPYAIPFYPSMDIKTAPMEKDRKETRMDVDKNIDKKNIAAKLQVDINTITLREELQKHEDDESNTVEETNEKKIV